MDKNLEKYTKKHIERVSNKLAKILRESNDTEFLEAMLHSSNHNVIRRVMINKNLSVRTMDKLLNPINYFIGVDLVRCQKQRVPVSSLVRYVKSANTDGNAWSRCASLRMYLINHFPQLTHLYPVVTCRLSDDERFFRKMKICNKRTHLFD